MTDLSGCDLAPARCPCPQAQLWEQGAAGRAAGAHGAGRLAGTWLTQPPHTGLLISAEVLQRALQLVMAGKCQPSDILLLLLPPTLGGAGSHGKSMRYTSSSAS